MTEENVSIQLSINKMFRYKKVFFYASKAAGKKFFSLPVLKIRSKNKDFFFILTNSKSKVQVSDSITNYFVWVQKKCIKQLCTELNSDWSKTIFNLQVNPSLAKKEVSQAFSTCNCTFKRGTEVLDSLNSFIMAGDIC